MADSVTVKLSHPLPAWADPSGKGKAHEVGDELSVDPATAERLVTGGTAVYATKSDAAAAGAPDAKTVRSK